jgi:hypothetical protein
MQLAAVESLARTADMNHTVWFWQPSFTAPWIDLLGRMCVVLIVAVTRFRRTLD